MGWSPVDGWTSGPGGNPRHHSYRPTPGCHPRTCSGTFNPVVPITPPRRLPPGLKPHGLGPPPQIWSSPGRGFGGVHMFDENHCDRGPNGFQRGPPPRSSRFIPKDFADMFGDMGLGGSHGSGGGPKSGNKSHNTDRDGTRLAETPVAYPLSSSGKKVHCIIDTGASITNIKISALRRYFPGIAVTRGVEITMSGISGKGDTTNERAMLPLTFVGERGELIRTQGEAWIVDGKHLDTDILLGLPFMRDNGMHLQWGNGAGRRSRGDHISCRGSRIPINIHSQS